MDAYFPQQKLSVMSRHGAEEITGEPYNARHQCNHNKFQPTVRMHKASEQEAQACGHCQAQYRMQ